MSDQIDWPLDRNVIRRGAESNTFGMVRRRADGSPKPHQGWDFHAPIGTQCHAVADGQIVSVIDGGDYGLVIVMSFRHMEKVWYAAYCHLSKALVKPRDKVTLGQVIGLTGDSGNARGMKGDDLHLHFEVRNMPLPGRGLDGRVSPLLLFGVCPMQEPVARNGMAS